MLEVTVYTVPNCADCASVKALLKRHGAVFTERNVRTTPVTLIGEQVFRRPFDEVGPRLIASLASLGASQCGGPD